ncbi:hypothetical protein DH2020_016171 [Rehmannia glutinosa]|uniref:Cytochrome P450 protein n=1 Tax=Rehmannia glutinosa TaxID=99300 RepID=A0ABR0WVS0_REHGL
METTWLYTFLSLLVLLIAFKFSTKPKRKLPPSPFPTLPLIGHLHLIKFPVHRTFQKFSDKLGPIFSLRLGNRLMVVVSSPTIVEECFTKNDIVLAGRPRLIIGKYIGYNYTTIFDSPYGDYWRNLRRLYNVEFFSMARLDTFQSIRQDDIKLILKKIYKNSYENFARVELRSLFSEVIFNNIMRMVDGKRYVREDEDDDEAKRFWDLIKEVLTYGGAANMVGFFPMVRWIDYTGIEKNLARLGGKMDSRLQHLIDKQRRNKSKTDTMIDHMLCLQESEPEYYTDVTIKGIILIMLIAGIDTSANTIEWAMSALLNHPEKLQKAKIEIDNLVGNDRLVNEFLPHEATSDCTLSGYDIPSGTILTVNAWAIHRDPKIWDDPTNFNPERFKAGKVGPPKLIPFGMGRRFCPGMGLAHRVVGLVLGSLIQCFEWQRVGEGLVRAWSICEGKG